MWLFVELGVSQTVMCMCMAVLLSHWLGRRIYPLKPCALLLLAPGKTHGHRHSAYPPRAPRLTCLPFPFLLPTRVFEWIKENLPRAKQQGAESAEQHRRKQNDAKAHTGNQVYSCGSLAPKLKKGKKGGCSDCEVCVLDERFAVECEYI